jgi:peptide deformylase
MHVDFTNHWIFKVEIEDHIQDLHDTLEDNSHGVALASNQIRPDGWRIFVVRDGRDLPTVMFNPSWVVLDDDLIMPVQEGCLSIPELMLYAPRHQTIRVMWQDRSGKTWGKIVSGLDAQIVQHEVEHLNGKLLIDYANKDLALRVRMEAIRNRKTGK